MMMTPLQVASIVMIEVFSVTALILSIISISLGIKSDKAKTESETESEPDITLNKNVKKEKKVADEKIEKQAELKAQEPVIVETKQPEEKNEVVEAVEAQSKQNKVADTVSSPQKFNFKSFIRTFFKMNFGACLGTVNGTGFGGCYVGLAKKNGIPAISFFGACLKNDYIFTKDDIEDVQIIGTNAQLTARNQVRTVTKYKLKFKDGRTAICSIDTNGSFAANFEARIF